MKHFTKKKGSDSCPLKTRSCSRAHCGSESGVGGCGGCGGPEGERETVHTAEKLDRLSAECAAGFWRPALLWDVEERSAGWRSVRAVHEGVETRFPVCISCVFNVERRAGACFLCVMGARPRTPTQRQHATRAHRCQQRARQPVHASRQLHRLMYTDPVLQSLQNVALERQSFLSASVFVISSDGQRSPDVCLEGSIQLCATLQKYCDGIIII